MLEIKNTRIYGFKESCVKSGYPMRYGEPDNLELDILDDKKNEKRADKLGSVKAGSGHDNFLKGIIVQGDLKYSSYITKQIQRYNFLNYVSSQSVMHTMTKRGDIKEFCNKYVDDKIIDIVNDYIKQYNNTENSSDEKYELFMKIVSNQPSGFELWTGFTTNYLQLKTIYNQRKNHKLTEDWGAFCDWILTLPSFSKIVLGES